MKLLTFDELRDALGGRGRTTVYRDIAQGRLPRPLRIGRRLYWNMDEVEAFVKEMADAR